VSEAKVCQMLQAEESVAVRHQKNIRLMYSLEAGSRFFVDWRRRLGGKGRPQDKLLLRWELWITVLNALVKLATDYNMALTHDEVQRQLILSCWTSSRANSSTTEEKIHWSWRFDWCKRLL